MADKKAKTTKPIKTVKKTVKKSSNKKQKATAIVQNKESLLSAAQIAAVLNIPSFEFFIIKNKYNIDDGALFTISQFKDMYKQAIEGR